jgi:uncharacterized sulfatase
MGFTNCRFMFNRGHWKKVDENWMGDVQPRFYHYKEVGDEKSYTTDWLTEKTIDFMREKRQGPFCYMVSYPDPHDPMTVREPYNGLYRPEDMPLPDTLFQKDLPDWAREKGYAGGPLPNPDLSPQDYEDRLRQKKAGYCGEVKCLDDNVGRIFACLEEEGILDDTVVVFTTDHGEYMGEHGLMGKNMLYETAYRVPLLIRWPKAIAGGTVVDRVVTAVDFQQTILVLMGCTPCGREQGRNGAPLLTGEQVPWMDECFIHHCTHAQAGIFTGEYELAYVRGGVPILFNRKNDPEQVVNLFADPAYGNVVKELTMRIVQHHVGLGSPASGWLREL